MVVKLKQKEARQNQSRGGNGLGYSGNGSGASSKPNNFAHSTASSGVGMHNYTSGNSNIHSGNFSQ